MSSCIIFLLSLNVILLGVIAGAACSVVPSALKVQRMLDLIDEEQPARILARVETVSEWVEYIDEYRMCRRRTACV